MKTLNTNKAGRMPLWQEDLNWMQASYKEAIEAIVGELGLAKDYFIISGCSPYNPGGNQKFIAMNAGWFWYGGEILPVRALSSTDITSYTNPMVRLTRVSYTNPDGARNFIKPDLTTQAVSNVWQDDYLQPSIVECSSVGGNTPVFTSGVRLGIGAWTLSDIIAHNKQDNESDWISSETGAAQYKRIGRIVLLKGEAYNVNTGSAAVDEGFPLPLGGKAIIRVCASQDDLGIEINGSGQLFCFVPSGGYGDLFLDGMTYIAATPYQETDHNTINDNSIAS